MRLGSLAALAFSVLHVFAQGDQTVLVEPQVAMLPTLADLLTIESSTSIFYSYSRELASISDTLSDSQSVPVTLIAPTNKAVMALARKPHQGPVDSEITITDEELADAQARANVERWVSAHIIPQSPITFDETYPTLLTGKSITFKGDAEDWRNAVIEGDIHIVGKREASNGVLFLVDRAISSD
ncbi:hypothetical protein FB45DRAFT_493693 [Roridomyces roridus]|uniref:FAS1 domain-containing protein n=1 Tax=Roridomyces roridus TaxID=1738132 RepID=A0AAD7FQ24_9AGAR|nr:hypothetical protein FB45DRAFT_493693 [Roridomyces roridus]